MMQVQYFCLLLVLLFVSACGKELETASSTRKDFPPDAQKLKPATCKFWEQSDAIDIRCYTFHSKANFRLPVVVFSKTGFSAKHLLMRIPGGPGNGLQTSQEQLQALMHLYEESDLNADVLIFNPRGVPGTAPQWQCPAYEAASLQLMSQNLNYEQETKLASKVLNNCLLEFDLWLKEALGNKAGVSVFRAAAQAKDVTGILSELVYEQKHLWGISYGTRIALEAASLSKADSELDIASLILDSVYPFHAGRQSEWAALQEKLFSIHASRYASYSHQNPREFRQLWNKVLSKIRALSDKNHQTLLLSVDNWHAGLGAVNTAVTAENKYRLYMNEHRMQALLSFVNYDENLLTDFYAGLEEFSQTSAQQGFPGALKHVAEVFVNGSYDPAFSSMVFFASECNDNQRESNEVWHRASSLYPQWQDYLSVNARYDVCKLPPFNSALAGIDEKYNDSLATLMLAGEWDHVTPASWAETLAEDLALGESRPMLITVPKSGHSLIGNGSCQFELLTAWITEGPSNNLISYCEP